MKKQTTNYSFACMRIVMVALFVTLSSLYTRAIDATLYVGESIFLENPSTPGSIDAIAWYSDHNNNIYISEKSGGALVRVDQYFSDIATIEYQYGYTYYIGSSRYHGTGHGYFEITCRKSQTQLNLTEVVLAPGETATLSYTNSSGYKVPFPYFKTDDKKVAMVNDGEWDVEESVTVNAVSPGTCAITFYGNTGGTNPTCKVTVRDIPATAIRFNPNKLNIRMGKTGRFSVEFTPSKSTSTLIWSSDNEGVASINKNSGTIKGVSEGQATITAVTSNGLTATGVVTIVPIPNAVSLPSTIEMTLGFSKQIVPTFVPANAETTCRWVVENNNIAKVDAAGNIKAIDIGITTITVTTDNGKKATAQLIVKAPEEGLDIRSVTTRVQKAKQLINKTINEIK